MIVMPQKRDIYLLKTLHFCYYRWFLKIANYRDGIWKRILCMYVSYFLLRNEKHMRWAHKYFLHLGKIYLAFAEYQKVEICYLQTFRVQTFSRNLMHAMRPSPGTILEFKYLLKKIFKLLVVRKSRHKFVHCVESNLSFQRMCFSFHSRK